MKSVVDDLFDCPVHWLLSLLLSTKLDDAFEPYSDVYSFDLKLTMHFD